MASKELPRQAAPRDLLELDHDELAIPLSGPIKSPIELRKLAREWCAIGKTARQGLIDILNLNSKPNDYTVKVQSKINDFARKLIKASAQDKVPKEQRTPKILILAIEQVRGDAEVMLKQQEDAKKARSKARES